MQRATEFTEETPGVLSPPATVLPDGDRRLSSNLEYLVGYVPLAEIIENFWLDPANQKVDTFTEHMDINTVMLATSLIPDGYLSL
jgi:hypothetical protein